MSRPLLAVLSLILGIILLATPSGKGAESISANDNSILNKAIQGGGAWDGPKSGPAIQSGVKIVFIAGDVINAGIMGVFNGFKEAAKEAGWIVEQLSGDGNRDRQIKALEKAIEMAPKAIVICGFDPFSARELLAKAKNDGITMVSWHASPEPGPLPDYGIFYNVSTDSYYASHVAALYLVKQSGGKAKVVVFTDNIYEVAVEKANHFCAALEEYPDCELLELVDLPLVDAHLRMPEVMESLMHKFAGDFQYAMGINDLYFDAMESVFKKNGQPFPQCISVGDGSPSAYSRIKSKRYQIATVPEPLLLQGWQLVDEINRSLHGLEFSGYIPPVSLITQENIATASIKFDTYDPDNNFRQAYRKIWGLH
ncbi:MAG: substrate-binding domain-containing protein [Planctomycetota bacterium]|jgi:ribose transport system substrate-binding protein|nr:substrate-binding domain-containing protein [Planctomycetota bacterium]